MVSLDIDMPETCSDCMMCDIEGDRAICLCSYRKTISRPLKERAGWCPLNEMTTDAESNNPN